MPKRLKIGIVGCGAIGSSLAKVVLENFSQEAELTGIYDIQTEKAYQLAIKLGNTKLAVLSLESLINKKVDLVIEATRLESSFEIAQKTISLGSNIMIMSVGGIIEHYPQLVALAKEKNAHIYIPSGAVAGIDGLKAAVFGKIKKIILTTKKPPQAFLGVPYVLKRKVNLENLKEETILFEGDVLTATRAFPQNINVAATLSLAGRGFKDIVVRIVASPKIKQNIHEVEIESEAGRIITRTENVVHPKNPKTSYLAVLSAIATLKQILEPIRVGT
ncbi:MAG: aspartate dehydrogenase [Candidatus Omnitrophica bacterium]|nr:aspartate dehydrogenase [Candidatus Omnitrophota bacterium]